MNTVNTCSRPRSHGALHRVGEQGVPDRGIVDVDHAHAGKAQRGVERGEGEHDEKLQPVEVGETSDGRDLFLREGSHRGFIAWIAEPGNDQIWRYGDARKSASSYTTVARPGGAKTSIVLPSSSVKTTARLPRLSRSCSMVRGPMIGLVTPG
jgi:hypothetical protein